MAYEDMKLSEIEEAIKGIRESVKSRRSSRGKGGLKVGLRYQIGHALREIESLKARLKTIELLYEEWSK